MRISNGSWVFYLLALFVSSFASADVPENPDKIDGARSFVYKKVDDIKLRLHVFGSDGDQLGPKP